MKQDSPLPSWMPRNKKLEAWLALLSHNIAEMRRWLWLTCSPVFDKADKKERKEERRDLRHNLRWHLKEVILCLVLLLLFGSVDKVQQFFTSFAMDILDEKSGGTGITWWMFVAVFLGQGFFVMWLSYVFWHKPKNVRGTWADTIFGRRRDASYTKYFRTNNGLWWLAAVAAVPVVIASASLSMALAIGGDLPQDDGRSAAQLNVWSKTLSEHRLLLLVGLMGAYLFLTGLFKPAMQPKSAQLGALKGKFWRRFWAFAAALALAAVGLWYFTSFKHVALETAFLLWFALGLPLMLAHLWYAASRCLRAEWEADREGDDARQKDGGGPLDVWFNRLRIVSYALGIALFLAVNCKEFTAWEGFSLLIFPLPMLLFVFIFYYQAYDFLEHNVTAARRLALGIGLVLVVVFCGQKAHFSAKFRGTTAAPAPDERLCMSEYFRQWARARFTENPGSALTVYLVAAEGGGSRSGAWTSSVLLNLDAQMGGAFRKNCFAISSVSGGSVGSAATLAFWDNTPDNVECYNLKDSGRAPSRANDYVGRIFGRNYISTALAGIFFFDFWQRVPLTSWLYASKYCRTDRHQDEENDAVGKALDATFCGDSRHDRYFKETSFLSLYRKPDSTWRTDLPLFFPNTARISDGKRGICSAVKMCESNCKTASCAPFVGAVDVLGLADTTAQLSLSEATGLSQLFPYVNANIKVPGAGWFMDGGVYENMGLTTLMDIRRTLGEVCTAAAKDSNTDSFEHFLSLIQFKLVLIYNVQSNREYDAGCCQQKNGDDQSDPSLLLAPVMGLLNTPFSGHTDHAYLTAKALYGAEIAEFPLIKDTSRNPTIVMSRWLSKHELHYISGQASKVELKK